MVILNRFLCIVLFSSLAVDLFPVVQVFASEEVLIETVADETAAAEDVQIDSIPDEAVTSEQPTEETTPPEVTAPAEKVDIKVIFRPENCVREVESGDFVRYHYYGMLADGTVFDSSYERGRFDESTRKWVGHSYNTYVDSGWLIPGMDQALLGMCINEHRLVTIPPSLAYGDQGSGSGSIPGGADIMFNYVLLDVWNEKDTIKVETTLKPDDCIKTIVPSDYVRYHYNGTLSNGKPFHSSYLSGSTYNTYVGKGWLIKGMDKGLVGACVGERRKITIPPHMGYGVNGDGKNIPPSASIIFDVEIVDFHNPNDKPKIDITQPAEKCLRKLENTDYIRYHYNGTLMDGTVFDTSYQRGHTYNTYVGTRSVIPGMEVGLLGVCIGEKRKITIPPHYGYGERGIDGVIPGSAVIVFEIDVIDFHNPNDITRIETSAKPDECKEEGARVSKSDDFISFTYEIRTMDGVLADSNTDKDDPATVYLGRKQIIPGAEDGLTGMCVGEVRKVIVPPHLAYGEHGRETPDIPGSAVLEFTFELLSIKDGVAAGKSYVRLPAADGTIDELTFETFDVDKDDSITIDELRVYLHGEVLKGRGRLAPDKPAEEVITDLFIDMDWNQDEKLSKDEFSVKWVEGGVEAKISDEL